MYIFHSGANPNIQTIETEELKQRLVDRRKTRSEAKAEARRKAIAIATELENQKLQEALAAEELEKQRNRGSSSSASEPRPELRPNDSFEADLGKVPQGLEVAQGLDGEGGRGRGLHLSMCFTYLQQFANCI